MHLAGALFLSHDTLGPLLISQSSAASLALTSQPPTLPSSSPAMWRVCTCAPFPISFFSCSINLPSQPDVGRASCIPNTKNNHFSVTEGVESDGA